MMNKALFYWNMNPVLVKIGPLTLHWYGVFFAASFISGFIIMHWIYKREGIPEQALDTLFFYLFFGTLVGARLGHCFFTTRFITQATPLRY